MSLPQPPTDSPHAVSTLTLEAPLDTPIHSSAYTDASGAAILSATTVLVTLYYPCPPTDSTREGASGLPWLESPKLRSVGGLLKYAGVSKYLAPVIVLPAWSVIGQQLPCFADQPLDSERQGDAKRKTIVLSHGLGGTRTTYSTLCIGLAAQGNVVAAIEHRDGTAASTTIFHPGNKETSGLWSWIPGGSKPRSTGKTYIKPDEVVEKPESFVFRRAQLVHRQAEIDAAFALLRRIDAGEGEEVLRASARAASDHGLKAITSFRGQLDLEAPWIAGHSFGAATALGVVRNEDTPFVKALLMDPWVEAIELDAFEAKPVRRPVYTINSEHFTCWKSHMDDVVRIMKGARKATGDGWLATLSAEPGVARTSADAGTADANSPVDDADDEQNRDDSDAHRLVVVHDMFGTLFSLSEPTQTLLSLFPSQLSPSHGASVAGLTAELIVMDWFHATQRDFTYASVSGSYTTIATVFKATLPRVLLQAGILPRSSEGGATKALEEAGSGLDRRDDETYTNPYGHEVVDAMMDSLKRLSPRPGMVSAFRDLYRDRKDEGTLHESITKVDLWVATNGSLSLGRSSLLRALGEAFGNDLDAMPSSSSSTYGRNLGNGPNQMLAYKPRYSNESTKPALRLHEDVGS